MNTPSKKAAISQSLLFERRPQFSLVLSPARPSDHQMSLISALLAIVLFFSGFAVAQITAPKCSSTWEWVRKLSSPHCNFWPLPDLTAFAFSHLILSAKIHV
jgi:hypothetical protein